MTKVRYFIEAAALYILMLLFTLLGINKASNLGGMIGRIVGPRLAASRKAEKQLRKTIPDMPDVYYNDVITDMWENLGRVIAEYPHLKKLGKNHCDVINAHIVEDYFSKDKPCLFISGHFANWEVPAAAMYEQFEKELDLTYRAPNNPWVDKMLMKCRSLGGKLRGYAKSREGAQQILQAMRDQRYIGFLIDQKYNEGVAISFMGQPAMTNPVFVQLAQKFKYPVIPIHIERLEGAHFRLTVEDPISLFDDKNEPRPLEEVIKDAHLVLERWIMQNPSQWLWLHRRWDSEALRK